MNRIFGRLKRIFIRRRLHEDDLQDVDANMLDDPSLTPMEKMSAAFLQFHRSSMMERREERTWKRRRNVALIVFAISGTLTSIVYNANRITKNIAPRDYVAVINIVGAIGDTPTATYGPVNDALKEAFEDPRAKRILLRIDSPGGRPNESEAIINELARLQKEHNKPVDAVIENVGASAAYMIAVHTDTLYAGRYSLVGSVGAILDTWNFGKIIEKVDAERMTFVSGRYKDLLTPYRPMREDERVKVQTMVNQLASVFADEVIERRKGKIKLNRAELTTGELWVGSEAVKHGLVDKVGTITEVAAAHNLDLRVIGPTQPRGFFIPLASSFFEDIGASFARGFLGRSGVVPN